VRQYESEEERCGCVHTDDEVLGAVEIRDAEPEPQSEPESSGAAHFARSRSRVKLGAPAEVYAQILMLHYGPSCLVQRHIPNRINGVGTYLLAL